MLQFSRVNLFNIKNLLFLISIVLIVSSCSSNKKVKLSKPTPLTNIENSVVIKKLWSSNVGNLKKQSYYQPYVAFDGNQLYASNNSTVSAFNAENGKRVWRKHIKKANLTGSTGVSSDYALVGDDEGTIYALDKNTGILVWSTQIRSEVLTPPTGDGDIVIALSGDGFIYGLNASDGTVRWFVDSAKPILLRSGISPPILVDGVAYIGQDNGKVIAINSADGIRKWEARIAIPQGDNELERLIDIDGAPLHHSGSLYAASFQGAVMGLSLDTGRPEWVKKISTSHPLNASGGTIVASQVDSIISAFSVGSGNVLWENEDLKFRKISSAAVSSDHVVVVDYKGYLHVLNRRDGTIIARDKIASKGAASPLNHDGDTFYILTKNGKLQSYSIGK